MTHVNVSNNLIKEHIIRNKIEELYNIIENLKSM